MSDLCLIGYRYSVYTRAARMGLHLAGCEYAYEECDPFNPEMASNAAHPMGRVPVLRVGNDTLYETAAILAWCDATRGWQAPPIVQARAAQVGSIVDAYGYWPLVRQVYSHGWFRPSMGAPSDPEELASGLEASACVLNMLEDIAQAGEVLTGADLTRADCHLCPMIDAFQRVPEGAAALAKRHALAAWFDALKPTQVFIETAQGAFPEAA
ncbi:glutathione S-transferase family protein [Tateyamaria omphalii]|uniref:glutathione S-transferase family protein n=1 Tax=Tateyamaria omphalii TaxID=299262 RepID=UPI001C99AE7B|nr:glutathione S-transferase family protein [Tateyamaria omphalii]MBY5932217.1 glutathione S-transferase family protein [Tateyamaria omphalii]